MTAKDVFDDLVNYAVMHMDDGRRVEHALRTGSKVPDRALPGRVILSLSPERREALRGLTAAMTNDRQGR